MAQSTGLLVAVSLARYRARGSQHSNLTWAALAVAAVLAAVFWLADIQWPTLASADGAGRMAPLESLAGLVHLACLAPGAVDPLGMAPAVVQSTRGDSAVVRPGQRGQQWPQPGL